MLNVVMTQVPNKKICKNQKTTQKKFTKLNTFCRYFNGKEKQREK